MDSRIGELLTRHQLTTAEQLNALLASRQKDEVALCDTVVTSGVVDAERLAQILAGELRQPVVDLDTLAIAPEAARLVPESVARRYHLIAAHLSGSTLTVVMADPTDLAAATEVRMRTGYSVRPVLGRLDAIDRAIALMFGRNDPAPSPVPTTPATTNDTSIESAPVIRLVDALLHRAIDRRASDLHFEPYADGFRVRLRVDGLLHETMRPPHHLKDPTLSRLKILASLNIAERRLPQDGRFRFLREEKAPTDFRVSALPTLFGEKIVLRVLDHGRVPLDVGQLGLNAPALAHFRGALRQPHGMVLVTGPTGSGKTTTLYAALAALNQVDRNVCTVEDPVELNLPGINQVQVNDEIDFTFARALRALLRQDPDVIMIGEIRDPETAAIAVRAALTGHLVLSTLHTNDAASAVARLADMGVPPFLLASALNLVVAQRLLRRRCSACNAAQRADCSTCAGTGYAGRFPIFEVLPMSGSIRAHVQAGAAAEAIRREAVREGMEPLDEAAAAAVASGATTNAEAERTIGDLPHMHS